MKLDQIKQLYVSRLVDGMDIDSLLDFAYEQIMDNIKHYTLEDVISEIKEYDPEMLDQIEGD